MTSIAPTTSATRRIIIGLSWIGAALAFLPGAFYKDPNLDHAEAALATIAANPQSFLASTFLALLYTIVLVPALLGVAALPQGRGARLAFVGASLALIGNLGHAVYVAFALVVRNIALAGDRAQMVALMNRINGDEALLFVLPLLAGFALGLVLTIAGLYRARLIGIWPVALIIATAALDFGGFGEIGYLAKVILGTAAFGWVGVALIAGSRRAAWAVEARERAPAGSAAGEA